MNYLLHSGCNIIFKLFLILLFIEFNSWFISLLGSKFHIVPSTTIDVRNDTLQFVIETHVSK